MALHSYALVCSCAREFIKIFPFCLHWEKHAMRTERLLTTISKDVLLFI